MTCCEIARIVFYIALILALGSRVKGWLRQRKASSLSTPAYSQDQSLSPQQPPPISKPLSACCVKGNLTKLLHKLRKRKYDIPGAERDGVIQRVEQVISHLAAAREALVNCGSNAIDIAARKLTMAYAITGIAWRNYLFEITKGHDAANAFDDALRADARPLREELARLLAKQPGPTVNLGSNSLLCSACGADAMTFRRTENEMWYETLSPVNTSLSLSSEQATQVQLLLDERKAPEIVAFLNELTGPGFAQYCPECDRIYCKDHLAIETVWSGSWHEATYAICPLGHRREFE